MTKNHVVKAPGSPTCQLWKFEVCIQWGKVGGRKRALLCTWVIITLTHSHFMVCGVFQPFFSRVPTNYQCCAVLWNEDRFHPSQGRLFLKRWTGPLGWTCASKCQRLHPHDPLWDFQVLPQSLWLSVEPRCGSTLASLVMSWMAVKQIFAQYISLILLHEHS